jgi:hypothetical protein
MRLTIGKYQMYMRVVDFPEVVGDVLGLYILLFQTRHRIVQMVVLLLVSNS